MFFSSGNLLRFTPPSGYHSRVSQEVSCSVGLTGSSSLSSRRGQAVPGIDFAKLATMVSIAEVLTLLDFVPAKSGKATTRPLSFARLRKSKKPVFFRESGKAHVPVLHLQKGGKSVGPLGGGKP